MTQATLADTLGRARREARALRRRALAAGIGAAGLLVLGVGSVAAAAAARPEEALAAAASGALSLPVGGSLAAWTLVARSRLHAVRDRTRSASPGPPGPDAAPANGEPPQDRPAGIEEVVARFYAACSGSAFERRWPEFAALFGADARLVQVSDRPGRRPELTVGEFVALARTSEDACRFQEGRRVVHRAGALAVVLSEFDAVDRQGTHRFRGVNCFELFEDGGGSWRIGRVLCAAAEGLDSPGAGPS